MNTDDVGTWRFCPACGAPAMAPLMESEDQYSDAFNFEDVRCSCCERPWIACPCEQNKDKHPITEDAALRIAQRVDSEDRGAPQVEIRLTPRALVRFFAIASLDYEERKCDGHKPTTD